MGKVVVESWSWRMVVTILWLLAAAAIVGVYRLGFLHGEIASLVDAATDCNGEEVAR